MKIPYRSKLVTIGRGRGVRIPRALLEEAGIRDEVEMRVEGDALIVRAVRSPRQGWAEQFIAMAQHGDDRMIDEPAATAWDETGWMWDAA